MGVALSVRTILLKIKWEWGWHSPNKPLKGSAMWGTFHCNYKNKRVDGLKCVVRYNVLKTHLQDIQYKTPARSACTWLYIVKSGFFP